MLKKNGDEVIVMPPEDTSSHAFLVKAKSDDDYYESLKEPDTV